MGRLCCCINRKPPARLVVPKKPFGGDGKYKDNGSYELELQIPHSVRAKIQAEGVLRRETAGNPAQVCRVQRGGLLEGKKQPAVVRTLSRVEVQIQEQGILVSRLLC